MYRFNLKGVSFGLTSGLTWAIDTILIGWILATSTFLELSEIVMVAPLISTFLHDAFSTVWMIILLSIRRELKFTLKKLNIENSMFVVLGALMGGPVGMTFYVLSVNNIGASFSATISAIYPAIGAFFAFFILKEKLGLKNWMGLLTCITFTILLGYSGDLVSGTTLSIGLIFIIFCVFGWGMESVILSYAMRDEKIQPLEALLIRQGTSAIVFGFIIIPVLLNHSYTLAVASSNTFWLIGLVALAGTVSYVFYYKAIKLIGPVKAMALNISYVAFAIFLNFLIFDAEFSFKNVLFAAFIMVGSITTVMEDKKEIVDKKGAILIDKSNNFSGRDGNPVKTINK